jgi:hypothetical protein
MGAVIIAVSAALVAAPALAQPLYSSTSFQGYRVCSGPGGYSSTEWSRDGMTFGQDNAGNEWTRSRWQDREITTVKRPPER